MFHALLQPAAGDNSSAKELQLGVKGSLFTLTPLGMRTVLGVKGWIWHKVCDIAL